MVRSDITSSERDYIAGQHAGIAEVINLMDMLIRDLQSSIEIAQQEEE